MKKIIFVAVLLLGAYQFSQNGFRFNASDDLVIIDASTRKAFTRTSYTTKSQFRCDGRQYCSQMTSRAEAQFFTHNCPNTKMDGDGDGRPCENDSRW